MMWSMLMCIITVSIEMITDQNECININLCAASTTMRENESHKENLYIMLIDRSLDFL